MAASPELIVRDGLRQLGLCGSLPTCTTQADAVVSKSLAYLDLLGKWNRIHNLTAVANPCDMAAVHLLDSFSVAPHLRGDAILDVGSGAGLPGIPLALLFPDKEFILLDSNARKTRFMTQARIELALANVSVVQCRLEAFTRQVDQVVCRAFASLEKIAAAVGHLLKPGGNILAMKGAVAEPLDQSGFNRQDLVLDVPFLDAARHLSVLTPIVSPIQSPI